MEQRLGGSSRQALAGEAALNPDVALNCFLQLLVAGRMLADNKIECCPVLLFRECSKKILARRTREALIR